MSDNGYTDDTVQPRDGEFTAQEPAIPGAPAQYMPAQFTPVSPGIPAEPAQGVPLEPLQPRQYMPAQYMPAQFTPAIPAEPALQPADGTPLESGERIEALPADGQEEGTPLSPLQPFQRAEALPLSPLQPFQRAEALPLGADGEPEETPRLMDREPEETEPRALESTGPETPRLMDREPEETEPRALESTGPQETPRALESRKPAMLDREAAAPGDKPPADNPPDNPPADNPPADNPPGINPPSGTGGGGPEVFVDTGKLAPLAPTLDGIMRNLDSIGNRAGNGIGGYRLNRGDSFGEAYDKVATPIASQILGGVADAATVFGQAAEGADLTVHNYDVTEENATDSAHGLLTRSEE
jgi:hypothetical protein